MEDEMADLRGSHIPEKMAFGFTSKIVSAILVALAFVALGIYLYQTPLL
jgi:hypothetical protein